MRVALDGVDGAGKSVFGGALIACLWASAALLLAASLLSRLLPADTSPRTRPIKLKDLGE